MLKQTKQLNSIWTKAAVLGSVWASSEIILGSFFHNLRIPFSSIILTGIAIILVVSVSYRWKERGLIWRAGVICAIMKSVSPSAIIFGPMIAILMEALLLEFSVVIFGKNLVGFIAGGILAMSWNLGQKIANLLIFYGLNIVDLYTSLIEYASRQLHLHDLSKWTPLLLLGGIYVLFGMTSAIIGIFIGKSTFSGETKVSIPVNLSGQEKRDEKPTLVFGYSMAWLAFTTGSLLTILSLMNLTTPWWWMLTGLAILGIWIFRYKGILLPLKKPKFWIIFIVITMLSSMVVGEVQDDLTWRDGLWAGVEMNFRAAIIMVGFSIIGKELSNPAIRHFFINSSFRQLPMALEVAFDTLPFALANTPQFSQIFKHPIRTLHKFGFQADTWLKQIDKQYCQAKKVIIITGQSGTGKSTFLAFLAEKLNEVYPHVSGIIAPCTWENEMKTGYELLNIADGTTMRLSNTEAAPGMEKVGRFYFYPEAISYGKHILEELTTGSRSVIIIDEIGPWELAGNGWSQHLSDLLLTDYKLLIISVRESLVEAVMQQWNIPEPLIIHVGQTTMADALKLILNPQKG